MALAFFDRVPRAVARPVVVFGRTPLFFYPIHLPLIHGLAVLFAFARFVVALFPICRWFDNVKRSRRSVWLSYL